VSGRRNKAAVEAWKATQPQHERRAKRRLLHVTARRVVARSWLLHRREKEGLLWTAIFSRLARAQWAVPDFSEMECCAD
jgi:hypothetical protein